MLSFKELISQVQELFAELEEQQGFLTTNDIDQIWSGDDRLTQFLKLRDLGFPSNEDQLSFMEPRRKFLSILVCFTWTNWHRFYDICLKNNQLLDKNLPFSTDLLADSFSPRGQMCVVEKQWLFIPMQIEEMKKIQECESDRKLPFLQHKHAELGKGRWYVHEETIPPGYYKKDDRFNNSPKIVAQKLIKNHDPSGNTDPIEIQNLCQFGESFTEQKCIMKHLALVRRRKYYDREREFTIIMEVADTDLGKFLHAVSCPADSFKNKAINPKNATMLDLAKEAENLAGALAWLHEGMQILETDIACCHMDLKPDNILIFPDSTSPVGRWKIADFELSTIRTPKEVPTCSPTCSPTDHITTIVTRPVRQAGPYVAPEICEQKPGVGRTSDIWSFGCILVDIIASQLSKNQSLAYLKVKRLEKDHSEDSHVPGNYVFYRDGGLNLHVAAWLESLGESANLNNEDLHFSKFLQSCKYLLKDAPVLWIDEPPPQGERVTSSTFSGVYQATQEAGIPIVIYQFKRATRLEASAETKLDKFKNLIYTLIYELQNHLNNNPPSLQPVMQNEFDTLGKDSVLFTNALQIFSRLWKAMPCYWFFLMDGFDLVEERNNVELKSHINEFLRVICSRSADEPGRSKTLIITSGRSDFLPMKIPREESIEAKNFSGRQIPINGALRFAHSVCQ